MKKNPITHVLAITTAVIGLSTAANQAQAGLMDGFDLTGFTQLTDLKPASNEFLFKVNQKDVFHPELPYAYLVGDNTREIEAYYNSSSKSLLIGYTGEVSIYNDSISHEMSVNLQQIVPEPTTLGLALVGALGLAGMRNRSRGSK